MESVFSLILDMSLTASYVIIAILLIRLLLRKAPKKYSYALWLVAAFRLICPVSIESAFSIFNFKFGKGAVGNAALLSLLMGQKVSVINEVKLGGETVSSSKIREHIAGGFIEKANALLGRSYSVKSPVIHGKKLGRTLGLPTINQSLDTEFATLKNGIYVSRVHVDGQIFPSVSNIGVRPSVESTASVNCETHIIGFDGDLYGKSVKVEFLKRMR